MQRFLTGRWFVALVVAAGVLTGCGTSASSTGVDGVSPVLGADYSGTGAGSLVSANEIPNVDESIPLGVRSIRVMYRSTSGIDGSPTTVSGAVFIPPGRPPRDGWPVVAFAHGTTGFNNECGPSLSPDLMGSAPGIAPFLREGFAVAAADYQGLGAPGVHPYLDAKTAGFNVIDSVRALHAVSADVSTRWAAFGGSQGGAAVWAANEQSATYAPELDLLGTLSIVPAADVTDLVTDAADQKLNPTRLAMYIGVLRGLERTHSDFFIDEYRRGFTREEWLALNACSGQAAKDRVGLLERVKPSSLTPANGPARLRLQQILSGMALPQLPASAPMLVIYAGQDEYMSADATRHAIERACALGDQIEVVFRPTGTHGNIDYTGYVQWIVDRFDGRPTGNDC